MGNSVTRQVEHKLGSQWVEYKKEPYCTILKNIETQQQAEQYLITMYKSIENEMEVYQYRYHQTSHLVSTMTVEKKRTNGFCNNGYELIVVNERIPKRISEMKNLKLQQAISILYSCLIGYKTIFEKIGYLEITADMIGFNTDNVVKVWVNQNFGKNYPEFEYENNKQPYYLFGMINNVLKIVSQHSSTSFQQILRIVQKASLQTPTFEQSIKTVQNYIKIKNIKIPLKLSLLPQPILPLYEPFIHPNKTSKLKDLSVLTSEVFSINTKQPIINYPVNRSKISKKYESPIKMLNRAKSDTNIHSILSQKYSHNNSSPLQIKNILRSPSLTKPQLQLPPRHNQTLSTLYSPVRSIIHRSLQSKLIQSRNTSFSKSQISKHVFSKHLLLAPNSLPQYFPLSLLKKQHHQHFASLSDNEPTPLTEQVLSEILTPIQNRQLTIVPLQKPNKETINIQSNESNVIRYQIKNISQNQIQKISISSSDMKQNIDRQQIQESIKQQTLKQSSFPLKASKSSYLKQSNFPIYKSKGLKDLKNTLYL